MGGVESDFKAPNLPLFTLLEQFTRDLCGVRVAQSLVYM